MTGIYMITNLINGKSYIGQSVDIKRRFWDHRCITHETNRHLKNALRKYGKDSFKYEILEECSQEDLDDREIYYIEKLQPEYNVTPGGQGRKKRLPESVKEELREKSKKQWADKTEEEKERIIRKNLTGPKVGHAVSEETRRKLREANAGKKQSRETIEKRRQTMQEKKRNGYVRDMSIHFKKVICIESGLVFESVKSAAEYYGINPSSISANLKGRQKTVKGRHFEYLKV